MESKSLGARVVQPQGFPRIFILKISTFLLSFSLPLPLDTTVKVTAIIHLIAERLKLNNSEFHFLQSYFLV